MESTHAQSYALAIASEIILQLGASTSRLKATIGANSFVSLDDNGKDQRGGLMFCHPKYNKINKTVIRLMSDDTYTIEYWNLTKFEMVAKDEEVYGDELRRFIEITLGVDLDPMRPIKH